MKGEKLFFIDAETDGLNGKFISVGIVVTDMKCNEIERVYYGIRKDKLIVTDPWTKENVLPFMGDYVEVEDEGELLEKVWKMWEKHGDESYAIADVIYPVEARLFQKCVYADEVNRCKKGPFPFIDISSLLYAKNIDPLTSREQLIGDEHIMNGRIHNAMYDVEVMIAIYKIIMK